MVVISAEGKERSKAAAAGERSDLKIRKHNNNMYERLLSIYLTPKAFEEIKARPENFNRLLAETKKSSRIKTHKATTSQDLNNSVDLLAKRASSVLPEVVSRNQGNGEGDLLGNRKSV